MCWVLAGGVGCGVGGGVGCCWWCWVLDVGCCWWVLLVGVGGGVGYWWWCWVLVVVLGVVGGVGCWGVITQLSPFFKSVVVETNHY